MQPVVLDTNTVLALWLFRDKTLVSLAQQIEQRALIPLSRDDALEELRHVLNYRQFALSPSTRQTLLENYCRYVQSVPETSDTPFPLNFPLPRCRDQDDQKFLEIAQSVQGSTLLTRDKMLLKLSRHKVIRNQFRIVSPDIFSRELLTVHHESACNS